MRKVDVTEITKNVKEMCIEANHFLSEDMKKVFEQAVQKEKAPLGRHISTSPIIAALSAKKQFFPNLGVCPFNFFIIAIL